ncbi:MAG: hypothetical protein ACLQU4_03115 [Limisphaerales bacterium]
MNNHLAAMEWADEKLDVLQNLESSVVEIWRAHPEMSDYTALRAYEAAFQTYRAELRGHTPKPSGLSGLDAAAFEAVNAMCEFRLARGPSPVPGTENMPPIPLQLLVDCLRELVKSVERHTKIDGRQGYLTFIDGFLP